ncbi:MAG: PIN domain nuclease [Chloroflexi bacterium]|nr:PIN domain nuclease [Chloroflexota bacterium]
MGKGDIIVRILSGGFLALAAWQVALWVAGGVSWPWILAATALGGLLGLVLGPYVTIKPFRRIKQRVYHIPGHTFFLALLGLIMGLAVSAFLALPLSLVPGPFGRIIPSITSVILAYLGASIMVMREKDLEHMLAHYLGRPDDGVHGGDIDNHKLLVDTSAIIDGRIADISQTGFIQGTMIIPRFVLDELRHIADSADSVRRNRGRRGLDMLKKLQKESDVPIQFAELDVDNGYEVDTKLVKLAKSLRCPIITNDFNLNQVAELQGVRVLNVNELANAVRTVVLPGEEMSVKIIQEGKELGQGVGFLDDGTMVVVEGGKRYLNSSLDVMVTRVLQTVAGRMIFAQPKSY